MIPLIKFVFATAIIPFTFSWGAVGARETKSYIEKDLWRSVRADLPDKIRFDLTNVNVAAVVPQTGAHVSGINPHPPIGTIQFQIDWQDAAGQEKHCFGSATIRAFAKVAVARTAIKNNEAFNGDNVIFAERELSPYVNAGYFLEADKLATLRSSSFLRPGVVLNISNTQVPYSVVAGEMLEISSVHGTVQVTAKVRAISNGRVGDWIRVENPTSKKVLTARVVGAGEVQTR